MVSLNHFISHQDYIHSDCNKKARVSTGFFIALLQCRSGMNSIHGTCIHASAAVDAGVRINGALAILLADAVYWAGILACRTICAIVGNSMSHGLFYLLLRLAFQTEKSFFHTIVQY